MSPPRAPTTPPRPPSPSPSVPRPLAVALTGGIAAGKSEALAAFARHGAATASSDAIVHDLLAHDDEAREEIRKRWGDAAVGDRARIGELVFGNEAELDWLEQLLHPKVVRAQRAWFDELMERDEPPALAVVEIPLLYETGGEERFDAVVVITAPLALRAERRAAFADREARLVPEDEKVRRADFAYVNDGTLEELDAFVAGVVERLSSS
jgi:dephospho-CoA kinase